MVTLHQTTQNSNTYMYKKFKFLQLKGVCELIGELKNPIGSYSTVPLIIFFMLKTGAVCGAKFSGSPRSGRMRAKVTLKGIVSPD